MNSLSYNDWVDDVKAIDDERWALSGCVYG